MSIHQLTHVWKHSPYSGNALLIHLALADFADEDGVCYPRKSTLAEKARCTEETVRTTLLKMAEDGEISILEEPGRGRYARAGRFQLIHKKSGDCSSIPKSDESMSKSAGSIPKSGESTPPIGTVIEPSLEPSSIEVVVFDCFEDLWTQFPKIRGSKAEALKRWNALTQDQRTRAVDALPDWLDYWHARGPENAEFIPSCASWLGTDKTKHGFDGFVPPIPKPKQLSIMESISKIRERDSL